MDLQYKMVLDPTCSVEGGVLFWKGRLTYKQAQSLRGDGLVKAIITIVADVPQKVIPAARMKRSKRQAKDQRHTIALSSTLISRISNQKYEKGTISLPVMALTSEPITGVDNVGLKYLSTAPGKVLKKLYTFGSQAGSDALVIVLDNKFPSSF